MIGSGTWSLSSLIVTSSNPAERAPIAYSDTSWLKHGGDTISFELEKMSQFLVEHTLKMFNLSGKIEQLNF